MYCLGNGALLVLFAFVRWSKQRDSLAEMDGRSAPILTKASRDCHVAGGALLHPRLMAAGL